jgi:hypothetical protein
VVEVRKRRAERVKKFCRIFTNGEESAKSMFEELYDLAFADGVREASKVDEIDYRGLAQGLP